MPEVTHSKVHGAERPANASLFEPGSQQAGLQSFAAVPSPNA